jgi:hypothetical protein
MIASNFILDCCKLTFFKYLFSKLGVDSEMKEYKLMPHGFVSFNFPVFGMRDEALEGIRVA